MKKIVFSLMAIALVVGLVGAGAFAYFSDTEKSTGNTFTAGTLDLSLTGGQSTSDSVIATWKSPDNWLPGDIVGDPGCPSGLGPDGGRLLLHNSGNIHADYVGLKFTSTVDEGGNPEPEEAGGDIRNKIIVTELRLGPGSKTGGWNYASYIGNSYGNKDGTLTLYELADDGVGGHTIKFRGSTSCGQVGICAGGYTNIEMTFEFAKDAGNQYQGDIANLTVEVTAGQYPTWPPPGCLALDVPPEG